MDQAQHIEKVLQGNLNQNENLLEKMEEKSDEDSEGFVIEDDDFEIINMED